MPDNFDVIVIGGGAAGLFCTIEAGKRGRRVLLIEHNDRVGRKIRISGGGRCNFTNTATSEFNFISTNPHFCKSALARFTALDFIALVEKHKIAYHEKKPGELFCDGSAQAIIDMLLEECRETQATILCSNRVEKISKNLLFEVETTSGIFHSHSLVIATGGLSIPSLGATDLGYRIAHQFDLKITTVQPGLVPFTFSNTSFESFRRLAGVSLHAIVSCNGAQFSDSILFTHRGLSGPAILQISSYWKAGDAVSLNLLPEVYAARILPSVRPSGVELPIVLGHFLPWRFARAWCEVHGYSGVNDRFSEKQLRDMAYKLQNWTLFPDGTEGYKKAEVTSGGVDTSQLSSKTMEATKVPGLFMVGEVVDVTGHLGGHNFQWAWSSGYAAGQYC